MQRSREQATATNEGLSLSIVRTKQVGAVSQEFTETGKRVNKTLSKDAERMEEIMARTADRCDIWQDRFVYWIAVAIYHIIQRVSRLERGESNGGKRL